MINSFKNPAIMRILRTTERHGAGWREQNFIPHHEAARRVMLEKCSEMGQKQVEMPVFRTKSCSI